MMTLIKHRAINFACQSKPWKKVIKETAQHLSFCDASKAFPRLHDVTVCLWLQIRRRISPLLITLQHHSKYLLRFFFGHEMKWMLPPRYFHPFLYQAVNIWDVKKLLLSTSTFDNVKVFNLLLNKRLCSSFHFWLRQQYS